MKYRISTALLALAFSAGAHATTSTSSFDEQVKQLLPMLMAPALTDDQSTPYDATKDCLLVPKYDDSPAAPACQIVLESSDYVPVNRTHTRFFIDTPDGQLGPFATGNLHGAPVAQPYVPRYDFHEGNQTQLNDRM